MVPERSSSETRRIGTTVASRASAIQYSIVPPKKNSITPPGGASGRPRKCTSFQNTTPCNSRNSASTTQPAGARRYAAHSRRATTGALRMRLGLGGGDAREDLLERERLRRELAQGEPRLHDRAEHRLAHVRRLPRPLAHGQRQARLAQALDGRDAGERAEDCLGPRPLVGPQLDHDPPLARQAPWQLG